MKRIYADWAASAPLCPAAEEELHRWLADPMPANPSSVHSWGMAAADRLAAARETLRQAAGWDGEVTFVSGGTEGLALAVYTLVQWGLACGRRRVILSPLEHPAVREAVRTFALPAGMTAEECTAGTDGRVDTADLARRLGEDTAFCACMMVQNETGVRQPVGECAALAHRCGARFLTDGVQAAGHIPLRYWNTEAEAPDMLVISGHKCGAMTGTGALFHRMPPVPLQRGGGQERGFRGGTENLPGICTLAAAATAWDSSCRADAEAGRQRDALEAVFLRRMELCGIPVRISGRNAPRIGTVSHFIFPAGPLGETLVLACDLAGLGCSAGSACHSSMPEPSPALLAMGYSAEEAVGAVRLSFGTGTSAAERETAFRILEEAAGRLYIP